MPVYRGLSEGSASPGSPRTVSSQKSALTPSTSSLQFPVTEVPPSLRRGSDCPRRSRPFFYYCESQETDFLSSSCFCGVSRSLLLPASWTYSPGFWDAALAGLLQPRRPPLRPALCTEPAHQPQKGPVCPQCFQFPAHSPSERSLLPQECWPALSVRFRASSDPGGCVPPAPRRAGWPPGVLPLTAWVPGGASLQTRSAAAQECSSPNRTFCPSAGH